MITTPINYRYRSKILFQARLGYFIIPCTYNKVNFKIVLEKENWRTITNNNFFPTVSLICLFYFILISRHKTNERHAEVWLLPVGEAPLQPLQGRPAAGYWPASLRSRTFFQSKSQALDVELRSCSLKDRRRFSFAEFLLEVISNPELWHNKILLFPHESFQVS